MERHLPGLVAGDRCEIRSKAYVAMFDAALCKYLGAPLIYQRCTKAGMAYVALESDPRVQFTLPPCAVVVIQKGQG